MALIHPGFWTAFSTASSFFLLMQNSIGRPSKNAKRRGRPGARNALAALLQEVDVDHGRGQIIVPEQVLNGADVGAALAQVRSEGMANGVGTEVCVRPARRTATLMAVLMTLGAT
jgi:hypothetical protein